MKSAPLVSIGCAVYNGEATLRRALDGVVSQDHPNVEIIICDDGSTDSSKDICREYAARFPQIRFQENAKNLGIVENFNQLFRLSRGKYFMWADQDDVRDPTFVSKCVAELEKDPEAVLCHSRTGVFWKDSTKLLHVNHLDRIDNVEGVVERYWTFLRAYLDSTIYGLIRSEALAKTSLWRLAPGASNALLFELLLQGKFRQVPEVLYFYSAKGPQRPSPKLEQPRGGYKLPKLARPFMLVAQNQIKGILASAHSPATKAVLLSMVCSNLAATNASKASFRLLEAVIQRRAPEWLEKAFAFVVLDQRDIHVQGWPEQWLDYSMQRDLLVPAYLDRWTKFGKHVSEISARTSSGEPSAKSVQAADDDAVAPFNDANSSTRSA